MGSPLAPVLADIFIGFYESKCLNEYNLNRPKFYLKYADHIHMLIYSGFDKKPVSLNFLSLLNKRHHIIKFKIEKQINYSIAFLMYSFEVSCIHFE